MDDVEIEDTKMESTLLALNGTSTGISIAALTLLGTFKTHLPGVHNAILVFLMISLWLFILGSVLAMDGANFKRDRSLTWSYTSWYWGTLLIAQAVGYAVLPITKWGMALISGPLFIFGAVIPFIQSINALRRR